MSSRIGSIMDVESTRSRLTRDEARRNYIETGELVTLEQIRRDAESVDDGAMAVGPFARVDANEVAARDGKTRGALTNVFGSQRNFQIETMTLALSAADWIERLEYRPPAEFTSAEDWLDVFLLDESNRGPLHQSEPAVGYATLWVLWLSTVPYGLWSETVSRTSMDEHRQWIEKLEDVFASVIDHFDVVLRENVTISDLAGAFATLIEGVWLNQCLSTRHPTDESEPIATMLLRSGRLLWAGATDPVK